MRCIIIGGLPATGKTTLIQKAIDFKQLRPFKYGLIRGMRRRGLVVLGIYDGSDYDGTDRLSFQAAKDLYRFLDAVQRVAPKTILVWEGDRFMSEKVLASLPCPWTLYLLHATSETMAYRRLYRGSAQSETWIKGRQTKLQNIYNSFRKNVFPMLSENDIHQRASAFIIRTHIEEAMNETVGMVRDERASKL